MKNPALPLGLVVGSLSWSAEAQSPCPGSESCPGTVAQMDCPVPGTTLPGNDVTFTWCNANADYFLDIESVPGAHDIFYALVPAQNFVHLLNLPTNGVTIYVSLQTQVDGQWQTPLQNTYAATNSLPPRLGSPTVATNGQFQFTLTGVTPGETNAIESSVDLSNWTSISTNVPLSDSLQFSDPTASNFTLRFYRSFEMR